MLESLALNTADMFGVEVQTLLSSESPCTPYLTVSLLHSKHLGPEVGVSAWLARPDMARPLLPPGRGDKEEGGGGEDDCRGSEIAGWGGVC